MMTHFGQFIELCSKWVESMGGVPPHLEVRREGKAVVSATYIPSEARDEGLYEVFSPLLMIFRADEAFGALDLWVAQGDFRMGSMDPEEVRALAKSGDERVGEALQIFRLVKDSDPEMLLRRYRRDEGSVEFLVTEDYDVAPTTYGRLIQNLSSVMSSDHPKPPEPDPDFVSQWGREVVLDAMAMYWIKKRLPDCRVEYHPQSEDAQDVFEDCFLRLTTALEGP